MKFKLVKKTIEAKDTLSFFFTTDEEITWQAGQYAYLTLEEITKQFTIASSPTEEFIQITTRIRKESVFKQNLNKMRIGESIEARYPFGSFVFEKNVNNIFLAGGIGITPFRSMIKYNIDMNLKTPIYLIYSNSDSDFVFKKELDQWQKENAFLKITYHDSSVFGHLDAMKLKPLFSIFDFRYSIFYAVGSNKFVYTMEDILEKLKVPEDNIKSEKFIGY